MTDAPDKFGQAAVDPFKAYKSEIDAEKALYPLAAELGFILEIPSDFRLIRRFVKGDTVLWPILGGWQCADLVPCTDPEFPNAKQYINHRPYADLKTALETEGNK